MRAEQRTDPVAHHGEGPVRSPGWGRLRGVGMLAGDVLSLEPGGSIGRPNNGGCDPESRFSGGSMGHDQAPGAPEAETQP